jgi:hypothetical protein
MASEERRTQGVMSIPVGLLEAVETRRSLQRTAVKGAAW